MQSTALSNSTSYPQRSILSPVSNASILSILNPLSYASVLVPSTPLFNSTSSDPQHSILNPISKASILSTSNPPTYASVLSRAFVPVVDPVANAYSLNPRDCPILARAGVPAANAAEKKTLEAEVKAKADSDDRLHTVMDKLKLVRCPGAGNCLFEAVARGVCGLSLTEEMGAGELRGVAQEMRAAVSKNVAAHVAQCGFDWHSFLRAAVDIAPSVFGDQFFARFADTSPSVEEYAMWMGELGVWGSDLEIGVLSKVFDLRVTVWTLSSGAWQLRYRLSEGTQPVMLAFDPSGHYDILLVDDSEDDGALQESETVQSLSSFSPSSSTSESLASGAESEGPAKHSPSKRPAAGTVRTSSKTPRLGQDTAKKAQEQQVEREPEDVEVIVIDDD